MTAILNDPSVGAQKIDVTTHEGIVTVSGRVNTPAQHDQVLALARQVDGVTIVKDALAVDAIN